MFKAGPISAMGLVILAQLLFYNFLAPSIAPPPSGIWTRMPSWVHMLGSLANSNIQTLPKIPLNVESLSSEKSFNTCR